MDESETAMSPLEALQEMAAKGPDEVVVRYILGWEYLKVKRYSELFLHSKAVLV